MYFLLDMGIFQPAMLVYQRVVSLDIQIPPQNASGISKYLTGCPRGEGNWGTLRLPREDRGSLGKIRRIITPPKNPITGFQNMFFCSKTTAELWKADAFSLLGLLGPFGAHQLTMENEFSLTRKTRGMTVPTSQSKWCFFALGRKPSPFQWDFQGPPRTWDPLPILFPYHYHKNP